MARLTQKYLPPSDGYIYFEEFALYVKVMKICRDLKTTLPPFVAVEMKRDSERFAKLQRGHERPKVSTGGGPPASPQTSPPPPNSAKESECKGPSAERPTPPSPNNDAEKPAGGRAPALKPTRHPDPPDDRRPFPRAPGTIVKPNRCFGDEDQWAAIGSVLPTCGPPTKEKP